MSASPHPPPQDSSHSQSHSLPPHAANPLLSSFTSFLTIAIHSLLYHRTLYPQTSFLATRAYNLPVHQSRHPGLCAWISDAVAAIATQLRAGSVRRIVLAVHSPPGSSQPAVVRERWVFDVHRFPAWGSSAETDAPTSHQQQQQQQEDLDDAVAEDADDGIAAEKLNWADIHEALRAALQRLAYAAQAAPKLPPGCTFTLALELRDEAEAPIGVSQKTRQKKRELPKEPPANTTLFQYPQPWIPSEGPLQPPTAEKPHQGESLRGAATKPVRSVRADPLFFECWLEQGPLDTEAASSNSGIVTNTSSEKISQ
ncbi:DNA polymerase zeta processivity subunit [Trichoderma lentiforme]|uniref:DNA polymerase zeta processivity subunit n=1 Tax=Trichoderma lentiforme TaxID=1567552 RepID=A0A9P5CIR0_9HYPO|nr:DNA polymerase zeta processivity subunit [Trichoderma lentiforme]